MIRSTHIDGETIDCKIIGSSAQLEVEYNAIITGMIKNYRGRTDVKLSDELIEKMLVEHIVTAFKIVDYPGGIIDKIE